MPNPERKTNVKKDSKATLEKSKEDTTKKTTKTACRKVIDKNARRPIPIAEQNKETKPATKKSVAKKEPKKRRAKDTNPPPLKKIKKEMLPPPQPPTTLSSSSLLSTSSTPCKQTSQEAPKSKNTKTTKKLGTYIADANKYIDDLLSVFYKTDQSSFI